MIDKLRRKIVFIVLLSLAIPLLIGIIFYDFSYYNSIVNSNAGVVDRFMGMPPKNEKREEETERKEMPEIDGVYSVVVHNNEVSSDKSITDTIKEYALKVSSKKNESGIIGNYIYKKRMREMDNDNINIILLESSNEIKKINIVVAISIGIFGVGIVLIYILSKKIASLIVKPVEETFTKQIDFISDASHELKTPLAVIQANADVLEGEVGKNKWLTYIQNETDNMNKLIQELLLLTKIENIDRLRKPETFNLSNHIELVVSSFESMAYEKKVKIDTVIQEDIITKNFNREDITHILSTLVDNAIKHTDEKKKVIVELKKNKEKLVIDVKNQGKEIPISERKKIFDRFYRIDKSRNRSESRYGLGLSIALSTVLKNNGTITVDYKDGYTIFEVVLPI